MRRFGLGVVLICLLSLSSFAQDGFPPNTIDCSQFKKQVNIWTEVGTATFDVSSTKHIVMTDQTIELGAFTVGGADLYSLLEAKCGSI